MATINCLQSPISSCKTSHTSSTVNLKVTAPYISSFCINNGLVINGGNPIANSLPQTANPYIAREISHQRHHGTLLTRNDGPLNGSILAAVHSGYKTDAEHMFSNCADLVPDTEFPQDDCQDMLEGLQELDGSGASICTSDDDERTLKLAVELTMLNLKNIDPLNSTSGDTKSLIDNNQQNNSPSLINQKYSSLNSGYDMTSKVFIQNQCIVSAANASIKQQISSIEGSSISRSNSLANINQPLPLVTSVINEERSKKSQNMTECVPVPSSEHVAEIVGRQGCKIKALRAKTNTYIKTPVRNEEPVFVVTGRKEDVSRAKLEILSAAEHFTVIRATRRINESVGVASPTLGGKQQIIGQHKMHGTSSVQTPGQVTVQVRVPYRLVGLVVGTKGNTIKHIQHETQTYIVTPSRDKEPIFEVTGMADNVELARRHIEIHIATRLGSTKNNSVATSASPSSPCTTIRQTVDIDSTESSLHSLNTINHILSDDLHSEILSSIYRNGICSTLECGHIRVSSLTSEDKCNNIHSVNGFISEDVEPPSPYALNGHISNQLKCADFVNNLIDTSRPQFCPDRRTKFS
ncbi:uncharacterized protein LOC142225903 [Haematobia irritans]|uniref:uncharacterized protein LOC142225903 n=1 Tax=Haematobia irritans TaxID=7368 RepID=UPI003F504447